MEALNLDDIVLLKGKIVGIEKEPRGRMVYKVRVDNQESMLVGSVWVYDIYKPFEEVI